MAKAFISGFVLCWSLLACFLLLADAKDWITIFEDWAGWIACFPLLIVGYPFHFIFAILIYFPWRNVWRPVSKERFEAVFQGDKVAYWKLGMMMQTSLRFAIRVLTCPCRQSLMLSMKR